MSISEARIFYKELEKCVEHLLTVCQHADEDCPSEYRTKWFNPSIQEAYEYVENLYDKNILEKPTEGEDTQ